LREYFNLILFALPINHKNKVKGTLSFLFVVGLLTNCSTTGIVQGSLCYPSEYIPAMNVYLKPVNADKSYKLTIKEDQRTFKFKKVPAGSYVAFAYTVEETLIDFHNKRSKASGGFTLAVPCGLTVACKDHALIHFKVNKGKVTSNIKICDWYGAIVPTEK